MDALDRRIEALELCEAAAGDTHSLNLPGVACRKWLLISGTGISWACGHLLGLTVHDPDPGTKAEDNEDARQQALNGAYAAA